MATRQHYAAQPVAQRLDRLSRTADELSAAIAGGDDHMLSKRPEDASWAPKEVICHLRDIEEQFILRFRSMLALDDPTFLTLGDMPPDAERWGVLPGERPPLDPERWAVERQYLRNDGLEALEAFRQRRTETLALLGRLTPEQWRRSSFHTTLGRMDVGDWVALIAAHDDNHLDQLKRAVQGHA